MYRAGAKGLFDTLAIHPYSRDVRGLLELAEEARALMDTLGRSLAAVDHRVRLVDRRRRERVPGVAAGAGGAASRRALSAIDRGAPSAAAARLHLLQVEGLRSRRRGWAATRGRCTPACSTSDGGPKPGFWVFGADRPALCAAASRRLGLGRLRRSSRRNVRLSPLGFAAVSLGCRVPETGACAGVLRLRSARTGDAAAGGHSRPGARARAARASGSPWRRRSRRCG